MQVNVLKDISMNKKKIIKHLKGDIKTYNKEKAEDVELIRSLKHKKASKKKHEEDKDEERYEEKIHPGIHKKVRKMDKKEKKKKRK